MIFGWERFSKLNSLKGVHGLLVESTSVPGRGGVWTQMGLWVECRDGSGRPKVQKLQWVWWSLWWGSPSSKSRATIFYPWLQMWQPYVWLGLMMVSESTPFRSWSLRTSCASLLQTSEEIFQHLQNIVDFGKNVMREFLGENYVHCGVSNLYLSRLSSWVRSLSIIPTSQ